MIILISDGNKSSELRLNRFRAHLAIEEIAIDILGIHLNNGAIEIISSMQFTSEKIITVSQLWDVGNLEQAKFFAWADKNKLHRFAGNQSKPDSFKILLDKINNSLPYDGKIEF